MTNGVIEVGGAEEEQKEMWGNVEESGVFYSKEETFWKDIPSVSE